MWHPAISQNTTWITPEGSSGPNYLEMQLYISLDNNGNGHHENSKRAMKLVLVTNIRTSSN